MQKILLSKEKYTTEVAKSVAETHKISNKMAIPKISKILVTTALGARAQDKNYLAAARTVLSLITGQKPLIIKARKSVASFKVREGMNAGCMVTLRRIAMYDFLDRLVYINLPRIKDFKGFSKKSFDSQFNFNIGIRDVSVFHEVEYGAISQGFGLNITICIENAHSRDAAFDLLKGLMLPIS